ncbi:hypothetical protein J8L86_18820 [Shewanella sp. MMG014]|uniref:hypothetical protein n=1 Tax=Shewanella sp. MMG014 TaxID=2822691 RepID=UPI001B387732|nr:hypothetical protein [Shewanella sp. MMG014]MBQ4891906.1 hypothetical protein [Shewanella sp. MMG014]
MKSINYPRLMQLLYKPGITLASLPSAILGYLKSIINKLTVAQKLYFIAFILMFTTEGVTMVGIIAMIAMMIEFWPLFSKTWHSLAGKAFLLLFYAIIANFSLVWAASVVNEVSGVDADHLTYTHNLVILLYMPVWFVLVSGVALMLLQAVIPIYFVLMPVLSLLGVKSIRFTNSEHYRKRTILLRMILAYVVLANLYLLSDIENTFESSDPRAKMIKLLEEETGEKPEDIDAGLQKLSAVGAKIVEGKAEGEAETTLAAENNDTENLSSTEPAPVSVPDSVTATSNEDIPSDIASSTQKVIEDAVQQSIKQVQQNEVKRLSVGADEAAERRYDIIRESYRLMVRMTIANFIYYFEGNQFSRCESQLNSKVIELNDYEILEITPTDAKASRYGYEFLVKACVSPAFPAKG